MIKLLIVDDEPAARYGLRDCIDWTRMGIELVGDAENGDLAFKRIPDLKPDILLTDVKMPIMDGLQLSEQVKQHYGHIKIIFVSGYDDVDYLKSAMKIDAIDYIFKPVNVQELETVIHKVVHMIKSEDERRQLIYNMDIRLMQSMPLLREKFFMTLMKAQDDISDHKSKMEFLDIHMPFDGIYCVFVMSIDNLEEAYGGLGEKDRQLTSFAVLNICQELIKKHMQGYAFENKDGEYVGILNLDMLEDEDRLYNLALEIKENLIRYLEISITIGVSNTVKGVAYLHEAYDMASEAVSQKLYLGKNQVITMDNLQTCTNTQNKLQLFKSDKLHSILKAADKERLSVYICTLFEEISQYRGDRRYCQNSCLHMMLIASRLLLELDIHDGILEQSETHLWETISRLETVEDMKKQILEYLFDVCDAIGSRRDNKSGNIINKVKAIILEHYHKNLTINDIAEQVYLTSTYLCLVFKQETGETVNDYLTYVRMEKARELLMDDKNKIYDVCYAVGYSEPGYFTKLFKKHTGFTPREYKDKVI